MVAEDRPSELEQSAARTRGERAVCGPAAIQDGEWTHLGRRQPPERRDTGSISEIPVKWGSAAPSHRVVVRGPYLQRMKKQEPSDDA